MATHIDWKSPRRPGWKYSEAGLGVLVTGMGLLIGLVLIGATLIFTVCCGRQARTKEDEQNAELSANQCSRVSLSEQQATNQQHSSTAPELLQNSLKRTSKHAQSAKMCFDRQNTDPSVHCVSLSEHPHIYDPPQPACNHLSLANKDSKSEAQPFSSSQHSQLGAGNEGMEVPNQLSCSATASDALQ